MAEAPPTSKTLTTLYNYFSYYEDSSEASSETVFHCGSKITIYLGENKVYNDGRCMLTSNYLVWRNTAHSPNKRIRILFALKHIKMMTVKSHAGKLSAFATPKLIIYLNDLSNNESSTAAEEDELYIQFAFKNGNESRNLFAKRLQSIVGGRAPIHAAAAAAEDESKKEEILRAIVYKEDVIDCIHEKYIKLTVTEFTNAIQALYFIQNYNATQNTVKLSAMRAASDVITRFVRYDNSTHHLQLNSADRITLRDTYFNYEPYLEISSPSKVQSYTSYHCHRFLDLNVYVFRLFSHIFPIKVSLKTQQDWIETILRCQWYLNDEYQSTVIDLIETLINEIWSVKFVPLDDVNFNDKSDLVVIKHLLSAYCHRENIPRQCHFKDLAKIYLVNAHKEELDVCLISVLNIAALETRFDVASVHEVMEEFVRNHKYTANDYVILQFIKYIRRHNAAALDLDLQHLLVGVIDEDEALKLIQLNLMINDKLIDAKWKHKYNGLNCIEYAQSKQVKPRKIIEFLSAKMEEYTMRHMNDEEEEDKKEYETVQNDEEDLMQSIADLRKEMRAMHELQSKIYEAVNYKYNANDDDDDENESLLVDKDWKQWTQTQIVQYIMSLEDGRYHKYKQILRNKIKYTQLKGADLSQVHKRDWSDFFGITNFADVSSLHNHIQALMAAADHEDNNEPLTNID